MWSQPCLLPERLSRGFADDSSGDARTPFDIGTQQGTICDDVDQPRNSTAQTERFSRRAAREQMRVAAGERQPVRDIGASIVAGERREVITRGDALYQLTHLAAIQHLGQFRLTQKNDA